MLFSIFCPHLNSACAMFRVKRVNLHLRNAVRQIYMKIAPFNSVVWGSLRLAPITRGICGILRGRFKVPLYSVFAIQAQDMTSQALYLRYGAYDVIVNMRSQTLYLRYSACGIILETKVTFMMESKTGFEISTKVTCQS